MILRMSGLSGLTAWLPSGHRLSDERWLRRHRAILWVLWPHMPALWLLEFVSGRDSVHTTQEIALLALAASVATTARLPRPLRTAAAVLGLVGSSSMLVHVTGGLIESHFHFFAVVAFITLYQEWRPFALAFGYVVVHHGVMGSLRPEDVYNHQAALDRPVLWGLIHGGFVALAALANLAAWRLAEVEREHADRVLAATGDGLYGVDAAGRVSFVNPALCELLGRDEAALVGADPHRALGHRLATGAVVDVEDCPICRCTGGQPLVTGEAALCGADGAVVPVEYLVRPLHARGGVEGCVVTLRDLRERRALEAEREQVEGERNKLASIVQATSDVALIGLPDGRLHWMNPAGRALLGFDMAEDIGGCRIEDLFSPEEMERIYTEDMPTITRVGSWQGQWALQARDGTQIPVAVTLQVHHDRGGERSYVSGIMRDLRPRLAEERKLRESEARLAEAERVAGLGSWQWDLSSGTVVWSPAMYRLHGMAPGGGRESVEAWLETVHPDDRARAQQAAEEAAAAGTPIDFVYRALHADGRELVIRTRGELVRGDSGQPTRMVGTLLDITDRHAAEVSLRASEERARTVIQTASDAYVEIDRHGSVTDWNRQAEATFGWSRGEAIGRRLATLVVPPRYRQAHENWLARLAGGGELRIADQRLELSAQNRLGHEFPIELVVWPIARAGDTVYGAFVRDISERRAVERAKDEFVSVVSHELRTPLTSIHGALGLLRAGLLGDLSDRGQRMVDIAVDNTDRLVRLINDILDIERLDSGTVALQREHCDAAAVVQRSVEAMGTMADQAGVRLVVNTQPAPVWADADRIQQTLTNLLSNAIKFSPQGGTVWVDARAQDRSWAVAVRDEGRGIPADKLEAIFERFGQVDASDSRDKGGTGLGLAICQTIVAQHGGRIWAESTPGEGATFRLTLPLASADEPADTDHQTGPTVLVCDEDTSVREMVIALLHARGYDAVGVAGGADIVDAAVTHRPSAILLDLLMPGVNGWQAAAALSAHPDTRHIPVVILSVVGHHAAEELDEVAGWLDKPIDGDVLVASMHRVVGRSKKPTLLLVEDDADLADVLAERFGRLGVDVHHAPTAARALELCVQLHPDLLVLDLLLPDDDGYSVVAQLRGHDRLRGLPLVVYTACDLSRAERERLRLGETQFFTKSRVSIDTFEQRVIGLLDRLIQPTPTPERTHA